MKEYIFEVKEVGFGAVRVHANNLEEAEEKAQIALENGEYQADDMTYDYEIMESNRENERKCSHDVPRDEVCLPCIPF